VRFIAEHKDRTDGGLRWGVESICAVLAEHGIPIAPSTYYDAASRPATPAAQRSPGKCLSEHSLLGFLRPT
jgi:putative transposase